MALAETINLNATQTPLPESSDLLTSMVTAISAAAAITSAAAAAAAADKSEVTATATAAAAIANFIAYQVTRQLPAIHRRGGRPPRKATPSSPPTPTSRTCASDRVNTQ